MRATSQVHDLPGDIGASLDTFVDSTRSILGGQLKAVVLYGSGAEGRLRPTSDVNVIIVISEFDPAKVAALRRPLALAEAAIRLTAMFLLEGEVATAMEMFGQKFSDIVRRHRVLYGGDPFSGIVIARQAVIWRTKQVLLNLSLRLRAAYVELGSAPERMTNAITESASPLRSCAATLRELEGKSPLAPKEALSDFVRQLGRKEGDAALANISQARDRRFLIAEAAEAAILQMIEWADAMRAAAAGLE